jgi:hypothetical protein
MRSGNQRTMVEMGLVGVVATQLWHHTYIDGQLVGRFTVKYWSVASDQKELSTVN